MKIKKLNAFTYLFLAVVIFCSCEESKQEQDTVKSKKQLVEEQANCNDLEIVVLDGCEYILFDRRRGKVGSGGICHKQNCKFCAARAKK